MRGGEQGKRVEERDEMRLKLSNATLILLRALMPATLAPKRCFLLDRAVLDDAKFTSAQNDGDSFHASGVRNQLHPQPYSPYFSDSLSLHLRNARCHDTRTNLH